MDVRMRINRWTTGRREMLNGHALTSGLVQGHFVVDGQGIDAVSYTHLTLPTNC